MFPIWNQADINIILWAVERVSLTDWEKQTMNSATVLLNAGLLLFILSEALGKVEYKC